MNFFLILVIIGAAYFINNKKQFKTKDYQSKKTTGDKKYKYKVVEQKQIKTDGLSFSFSTSIRENTAEEEEAKKLLKEATKLKDQKDLESAILCLRKAYDLMADSSISYSTTTYLRLPLYLQQAGHFEESIDEFETLLNETPDKIARELSHISKTNQKGLSYMSYSTIYDKMRLVYQREKYFNEAIYYQILSITSRAVGLKIQKRIDELAHFTDGDFLIKNIEKLLIKAKKEQLTEPIEVIGVKFSKTCTEAALKKVDQSIKELLEIDLVDQLN